MSDTSPAADFLTTVAVLSIAAVYIASPMGLLTAIAGMLIVIAVRAAWAVHNLPDDLTELAKEEQ